MDFGTDQIFVTGAAGWLGTSLVQALTRGLPEDPRFSTPPKGLQIRCLVLPGQARALPAIPGVEYVEGDLRHRNDCAKFLSRANGAVLFHTAGIIHPQKSSEFDAINVQGTENLLDEAVRSKVRRAVIVSSNSPCGCNPHPDHLFDEASPYHPYMGYGRSKMKMELAAIRQQESGRLETVIIRPPWFYGPNQPPRQTLFFRMIRDGKGPIVGDGTNLRSMAYVDNLSQGLILAATKASANGEIYWIADERPYSMNEVIDTIERLLENEFGQKCAHKRMRLPWIASEVAYVVDKMLQGMGLYHQKIHVLSEMNKTIACSVAKAKRDLEYRPRIALEEGMRRSIASIRHEL